MNSALNSWEVRVQLRQLSWSVWRMLIYSMIFGIGMSFFDVLFSFYLVSMDFGIEMAGILSTTARVAGLVVGIPAGLFIDRIGARRALIISVVAYVAALAWVLHAPTVTWLIISQFVAGSAWSIVATATIPLLISVTNHELQPTVIGLNEAAVSTISLVGSIAAGMLPSILAASMAVDPQSAPAYRSALLIGVAVILLAVVPVARALTPATHSNAPSTQNSPRSDAEYPTRSTWQLVSYALASMILGIGGGLFLPFQSLFFRTEFGLSDAMVGSIVAFNGISLGIGALVMGRLVGQRDLRTWGTIARMMGAPAMLLMAVPILPVAFVGYCLRGFAVGASVSTNDVLVMRLAGPRQRGLMSSIMTVLWSSGWAIAATASGFLQKSYGFGPILVVGSLAYVVSGLAIWYFERE